MADWLINWTLWHWLILGFILLIGEVLTPGIFLLWWGVRSFSDGICTISFSQPFSCLTYYFYALLACILSVIW